MNTAEMLEEVDRRVSLTFVEHLLPKAIAHHTKLKGDRCQCNYCTLKRQAEKNIRDVRYPQGFQIKPLKYDASSYENWEIRREHRDQLRNWYREQLKALVNE